MDFTSASKNKKKEKNKYSGVQTKNTKYEKPKRLDVLERALCNGDVPADTSLAYAYSSTHEERFKAWTKYHSELIKMLQPSVKKQVEELRKIQIDHNKIKAYFLKEEADLEAEFQKKYEPLYTKMCDIVSGVAEDSEADNKVKKGVPNFWLLAMKSNEMLAEEITERDEVPLKYLKHIKWCRIDTSMGFKLEFYFDKNPFFTNDDKNDVLSKSDDDDETVVLTKTYYVTDNGDGESFVEKIIGTDIKWTSSWKNATQIVVRRRRSDESYATQDCKSFFNIFKTFFNTDEEVPNYIQWGREKDLQKKVNHDYHVGCTIRDSISMIIPHAVSWLTGEAAKVESH